jgi:hypothetical protein
MTDEQIGYLLIGGVVAILLFKRWWSSRESSVDTPVTLYEPTGRFEIIEVFRPVTLTPKKPQGGVAWLVVMVAIMIIGALLSQ